MSEDDHMTKDGVEASKPATESDSIEQHKKNKRITIKTSAVTHESQQQKLASDPVDEENHSISQDPKIPAPWSKSEPLSKIHSLLGHMVQGDVYRNELDLVYDRLQGEAEAPDFIPPDGDRNEVTGKTQAGTLNADPFADGSFDFGMSVGEISVDTVNVESQNEIFAEDSAHEPIQRSHQTIFGDINLDDFEELQNVARTSIGISPEELQRNVSTEGERENERENELDDESLARLARLSATPEAWAEAEIDPYEVRRKRGEQTPMSFFESSQAINVEVIQGIASEPTDPTPIQNNQANPAPDTDPVYDSAHSSDSFGLGEGQDTRVELEDE